MPTTNELILLYAPTYPMTVESARLGKPAAIDKLRQIHANHGARK